jgi:hypothetical protein
VIKHLAETTYKEEGFILAHGFTGGFIHNHLAPCAWKEDHDGDSLWQRNFFSSLWTESRERERENAGGPAITLKDTLQVTYFF